MNFVLAIALISSLVYSIDAGECQVHNRPDYLSLTPNKNDGLTVSDFTNTLTTILGLSSDKTTKPFFYSTNPLQIPASTWLFHVEGMSRLFDDGISLVDDNGFNIDVIHSKLRNVDNGDALNMGSVAIVSNLSHDGVAYAEGYLKMSSADMDNFADILKKQVTQMDKQAVLKYVVVVCDDCQQEKLKAHLKAAVDKIIADEPQALVMTLVTKESARVRRARQAEEVSRNITIATMYSDEYPTMFNLFFWTSLGFAIILISIVYVFLTLDPGADTIIYRMTAPRLKVD